MAIAVAFTYANPTCTQENGVFTCEDVELTGRPVQTPICPNDNGPSFNHVCTSVKGEPCTGTFTVTACADKCADAATNAIGMSYNMRTTTCTCCEWYHTGTVTPQQGTHTFAIGRECHKQGGY